MRFERLVLAALLSGGSALLAAPSAPVLRVVQATVAPDGSAQALVAVTDAQGKTVRGLEAANFRVKVDGRDLHPLALSRSTPGGEPLSIVLAIDISSSMKGEGIKAAAAGASAFVDRLGKRDLCSLIAFGSGVHQLTEFTSDHERIKTALAHLEANESATWLYQAVFDALDRAATAPTARAAVVVLTDGHDYGSALGLPEVVAKAAAREVPVYTLGYGAKADPVTLRRIAAVSRGGFFEAPQAADIGRAYADIIEELQNQYVLGFNLRGHQGEPFQLSVAVEYRGQTTSASLAVTPAPSSAPQEASPRTSGPSAKSSRTLWLVLGLVAILAFIAVVVRVRRKRQDSDLAATMVPPRVWLEVVKGADAGQRLLLLDKTAVLGRDARQCQILLKNDPMVGRKHARFTQDSQGRFVVEDLGSQNGVTVNGVRITEPVTLQTDDRIVVGLSELLYIDQR